MKRLQIFAVALAMVLSSGASAAIGSGISEEVIPASLEIKQFLKDYSFLIKDECKVEVVFTLNSERQIVLHSISSKELEVRNFLKENLQGKHIQDPALSPGIKYTLPVRLEIKD
ncbi:hypothetical protein FHG64_04610 [Antarcticibacterium flavum]|uniref:TonB C-terminal domain-containing protein n=1 Tax=Antarcticibacterium flavum TaxID=2058175 RepID=A0A5B7X2A4_9FLAO|nr:MULTISPECIES: hypothetical protein [Antarcticibacterium]MCM4160189.1 hypothetical protein [Antarcticibacterium sp. W02-3]QCY68733.1 hypothetical protein FHG64_04610 [Antarcticibacterium flavum]